MFQSFSGNSRRPRQVNLSGQNTNPFASNPWSNPGAGANSTVANAQQERQRRQQERERLNASKRIQRVWRGHKARREVAEQRRKEFDELEASTQDNLPSAVALPVELQQLLVFFNARNSADIQRLALFGGRLLHQNAPAILQSEAVQPRLLRLIDITLDALQS
jgi:ubiquitin-protein ligase E3 C